MSSARDGETTMKPLFAHARSLNSDHKEYQQSRRLYALAVLALAIGALLRLVWPQDIEFKCDEAYMFERAMRSGISEHFPSIGMQSGAGTPNPALSIWIFVA